MHFQKMAKPTLEDPRAFLEEALLQAHRQILRYASIKGMIDTPRTTLVAATASAVDDQGSKWGITATTSAHNSINRANTLALSFQAVAAYYKTQYSH